MIYCYDIWPFQIPAVGQKNVVINHTSYNYSETMSSMFLNHAPMLFFISEQRYTL